MTVKGLCDATKLRATAVRYHLSLLIRSGLVVAEEKVEGIGRPRVFYHFNQNVAAISFPSRQYMLLSETLLSGIVDSLGEGQAIALLRKAAAEAGRKLASDLTASYKVSDWTPEEFVDLYVEGALANFGTLPELVTQSRQQVIYRERNCPFREMALKYPQFVCDALDSSFHESVCRAMNERMKVTRTKCVGHGDETCEYKVNWASQSANQGLNAHSASFEGGAIVRAIGIRRLHR